MHKFSVLEGKKQVAYKPTHDHYCGALERFYNRYSAEMEGSIEEYVQKNRDNAKKYLFLIIKFMQTLSDADSLRSEAVIESSFRIINIVSDIISYLTPREIMQMFPIDKEYDGEKYEIKDYWTTMEEIVKIGLDTPIGDKVNEFMMEYRNWYIELYMVNWMCIVNRMHRLHGGRDIMLEFFEEQGVPVHTMHREGDYVIDDETGERSKISKPKDKRQKLFTVV